jgi:hypothetical protein
LRDPDPQPAGTATAGAQRGVGARGICRARPGVGRRSLSGGLYGSLDAGDRRRRGDADDSAGQGEWVTAANHHRDGLCHGGGAPGGRGCRGGRVPDQANHAVLALRHAGGDLCRRRAATVCAAGGGGTKPDRHPRAAGRGQCTSTNSSATRC